MKTTHTRTDTNALRRPNGLSKAARIRLSILGLAVLFFAAGAGVSYVAFSGPRPAVAGIADSSLADRLGLSPAQKKELERVLAEGEARLARIRDEVQEAYRTRIDDVARETEAAIAARLELDPAQKRRFDAWRGGRSR